MATAPLATPRVTPTAGAPFVRVSGEVYRAVNPQFLAEALDGSRAAGRYSRPEQPTLYTSSSPEGEASAMVAHSGGGAPQRTLVRLQVDAARIFDLRDPAACQLLGIDLADATAAWQDVAAAGGTPRSWLVADRLRASGAFGLIDPSRTAPGLWHLVLFDWNRPGRPAVWVLP